MSNHVCVRVQFAAKYYFHEYQRPAHLKHTKHFNVDVKVKDEAEAYSAVYHAKNALITHLYDNRTPYGDLSMGWSVVPNLIEFNVISPVSKHCKKIIKIEKV